MAFRQYQNTTIEAFKGLSGFRRVVDDFVIYDGNIEYHIAHVKQFLKRCAEKHIALNLEKCRFFSNQDNLCWVSVVCRWLPDRPLHH